VELDDSELEVHLVVLGDLESIEFIENFEHIDDVCSNLRSFVISNRCINSRGLKGLPEVGYAPTESLYTQVELFVQLIDSYEVVAIEITLLLVLGKVHVQLLDLINLPEQVLLVDGVAALVQLGQLHLVEAAHLEYAEHLLLFI
jgi:hypothetical protein